ncbi:SDR family NAD(P)-dependent oxidoreductase [Amycolatopsis azurea]|uniref:SDR family NAD(P)-dependent oxidoreductase n=1 Tax=Amycolatopsis azurea TaxID=36819 RepID=UPI00381574C6
MGLETARQLARAEMNVVLIGRDSERLAAAAADVRTSAGARAGTVRTIVADLLESRQVRTLAATLAQREGRIDILINNAGAAFPRYGETADGVERTYAINHHAPFLLTHALLESATLAADARIINVSSFTESRGRLDLVTPDIAGTSLRERRYNPLVVYGTSKLLSLLATRELARRLPDNMNIYSADPGRVRDTEFNTRAGGLMKLTAPLLARFSVTPHQAVQTNLWLATTLTPPGPSGGLYAKEHAATPSRLGRDEILARVVYERTAELLGITAPRSVGAAD